MIKGCKIKLCKLSSIVHLWQLVQKLEKVTVLKCKLLHLIVTHGGFDMFLFMLI